MLGTHDSWLELRIVLSMLEVRVVLSGLERCRSESVAVEVKRRLRNRMICHVLIVLNHLIRMYEWRIKQWRWWLVRQRMVLVRVEVGGLKGLLMRLSLSLCLCLFSSGLLLGHSIVELVFVIVHDGCRDASCFQFRPLLLVKEAAETA